MSNQEPHDRELARLFLAYREACPDPEPDVNFIPRLWQRIDAQQSYARDLKRLAQGLVTAAAALSIVMGIFLARWESSVSFYTDTYLEVLAADQEHEAGPGADIVPAAQDRF